MSALLGLSSAVSESAEPWNIDTGLLSYIEKDRNTGLELLLTAQRTLSDDDGFTLGLEFDTLTGSTPNGATASNVPQTFTTSSGNDTYTTAANQLPADDTHGDTRIAIDAEYKHQFSDNLEISYNGRISIEFDYLSYGAGNSYRFDVNQKNTSLFFGLNAEHNAVHPVGNIPDALALMTPAGEPQNRGTGSENRIAVEAALGLTQVIDRRSLFQLRYIYTRNTGYLTDPYKLLSVIDDENTANSGGTLAFRFEKRPDLRAINTVYFAYKRDFNSGIINFSLRRSEDDWGLDSTTFDMRYRHRLADGAYIEPHVRFYRQNKAEFYRHSLISSEALPENASADFRLAAFDAYTVGLKYGFREINKKRYSLVAEYYTQDGSSHPDNAIGLQTGQDLFPRLHTLLFKLMLSTEW